MSLGKWDETGPGGLVDADMLEVCQFNGTYNTPGSEWAAQRGQALAFRLDGAAQGMSSCHCISACHSTLRAVTTSEGRLHYLAWVILPSPLILSCDVRTLNATAPGAACLDMLLNPEVLAINQDPAVIGARLLRSGSSVAPPVTSDDVTFQVFGRPLAQPGVFAALLANRATIAQNLTLSWAELGLPNPSGAAKVRDVGARQDVGSFTTAWVAEVPARDAVLVTVTQAT